MHAAAPMLLANPAWFFCCIPPEPCISPTLMPPFFFMKIEGTCYTGFVTCCKQVLFSSCNLCVKNNELFNQSPGPATKFFLSPTFIFFSFSAAFVYFDWQIDSIIFVSPTICIYYLQIYHTTTHVIILDMKIILSPKLSILVRYQQDRV